jgi:hypothetical protein
MPSSVLILPVIAWTSNDSIVLISFCIINFHIWLSCEFNFLSLRRRSEQVDHSIPSIVGRTWYFWYSFSRSMAICIPVPLIPSSLNGSVNPHVRRMLVSLCICSIRIPAVIHHPVCWKELWESHECTKSGDVLSKSENSRSENMKI